MAIEAMACVKDITLSGQQLKTARKRVQQAGDTAGEVEFALEVYCDASREFDRIVSVGMLEHVGRPHLEAYFAKVAGLLERDGVALIHSIGRWDEHSGPNPWTDRYIFPGSHIPALSEVMPGVERSGLLAADIEILRLHYAETLRHWFARFIANRAKAEAMSGEEFCRMWEFYLTAAEMTLRNRPLMVFQIQLAHQRDSVPLTRDYIANAEHRLREPPAQRVQEAA
jgi:cyclopropane-fatty-acyl-phospholipid synthase